MRKLIIAAASLLTLGIGVTTARAADDTTTVATPPPAIVGEHTSAVDGPRSAVSSLQGQPGESLTVAGEGCPGTTAGQGGWEVRVWLTPSPGTVEWDPAFGEPVAVRPPSPDGTWSVSITVPEHHTDYRLEAACFDSATPPNGFLYAHLRFVVP